MGELSRSEGGDEELERAVNEFIGILEDWADEANEDLNRISREMEELEREREEWRNAAKLWLSKMREWFGDDLVPDDLE